MIKIARILALLSVFDSFEGWAQSPDAEVRVAKTIMVPPKDPLDLDLHMGAGFGTFTTKDNLTKSFGGLLVGGTLFQETMLSRFTASSSIDLLIDGGSLQVIRTGIAGALTWNFLGGKKQQIYRLKPATFASSNPLSLGWVWRIGYDSFAGTPAAIGALALTGSNSHLDSGFRTTYRMGNSASMSLDLMTTVLSLAASIEKSTQKATELSFGWRYYL